MVVRVKCIGFGVWGGGKSTGGAHRSSKAKSAFLDGRMQTRKEDDPNYYNQKRIG
jgi:hypothetical protein